MSYGLKTHLHQAIKELIYIGLKNLGENPVGPLLLLAFTASSMITFGLGNIEFMEYTIDEHAHYLAILALMAGYIESGGQEIMRLEGYQIGTILATFVLLIGTVYSEMISSMVMSDPLYTMAAFLTTILGYAFITMGE